jgi:hypothetical protein
MQQIIPETNVSIQKFIAKFSRHSRESRYYSEFFKGAAKGKANGKRILIYSGIGYMHITPVEILMYHLLRKEGFEVDFFIYGENAPAYELTTKKVFETVGERFFIKNLYRNAKRVLGAAGVRFETIEGAPPWNLPTLPPEGTADSIFEFKWDGIAFGNIVKGVMYRFYKSTKFDAKAPEYARKFLTSSLLSYQKIKEACGRNEYRYVLCSHGIYSTWEPVTEFCRSKGVDMVIYDRAKTKGMVNFNINQVSPDWSMEKAWKRYSGRELTVSEETQVDKYLAEREHQSGDVFSYNFSKRATDVAELRKKLGIPAGAKVISIFTNLIWDAANVNRDLAFPSALDCILATIERIKDRPDIHMVVRTHPAEKVLGTEERYGSLVRARFPGMLPANVTILEPEDGVNSFSVIDVSDIGIVNTSTVGLEFALAGKPIILISETHYRGKGFTMDADSRAEYFSILENQIANTHPLPDQVKLARKYFFMMMFKYQVQLPIRRWYGEFNGYTYESFDRIPVSENIVRIVRALAEPGVEDLFHWDEEQQ